MSRRIKFLDREEKAHVNPDIGFRLEAGDELAVIALDEPQL
ncbi:MAG TPA: hypothetical protein VMX79_04925 [bacterium]|nr:hypothetical protein [bacterium]